MPLKQIQPKNPLFTNSSKQTTRRWIICQDPRFGPQRLCQSDPSWPGNFHQGQCQLEMETKAADDSHQMGYIQYWILDIHSLNGPLRPVSSTGYWRYIHIYYHYSRDVLPISISVNFRNIQSIKETSLPMRKIKRLVGSFNVSEKYARQTGNHVPNFRGDNKNIWVATDHPEDHSGQIIIFHQPRFPWNKGDFPY